LSSCRGGEHTTQGKNVRLGIVILGDLEETPGDGLECPKLGEPKALEIDNDECLAYRPTGGGRCGRENLDEERLDIDENRAPMLLWSHLTIEPLEADGTKILNVYRTTELYTTNKNDKRRSVSVAWSLR
jgi:hypothetical protein